jgi:dynein heavy chain
MDAANGELAEALPAMEAAKEAVNCLTKDKIDTVKALGTPPDAVMVVGKGCLILLKGEYKKHDWDQSKKMMNNPNQFIDSVRAFDPSNIDQKKLDAVAPILALDYFTFDIMKTKSDAAAYLCAWMINCVKFNTIYKKVKPLQDSANAAEALANAKKEELAIVMEKVREINEKVDALKTQLAEAQAALKKVEDEAQILVDKLDMANRLVNGLGDEKIRWEANVGQMGKDKLNMIGDALISAAFVSYIGPFSSEFRYELWRDLWLIDISQRGIPITSGIDPLTVLSNATDQAKWNQEGLQADRVSFENAAIVCECSRWPLLIDPQLQGQKWIKGREGAEMETMQLSSHGWLKKIDMAVTNGKVLMIESIGQDIDPLLDPLLGKQYVKKGRSFVVKIGKKRELVGFLFCLPVATQARQEMMDARVLINLCLCHNGPRPRLM